MPAKSTIQKFIKKASVKHNSKYDYSKVKYINSKTKIKIICPLHSKFLQSPNSHLNGNGCPDCGKEKSNNSKKLTIKTFIKRAQKTHNNKYNYSKVNYVNTSTKIIIICKIHKKEFIQTPNSHLQGIGCPICGGKIKLTTKIFIEKAQKIHNNKYNYSKVNYKNNSTKIIIICYKHGEFLQTPNKHVSCKRGCPKCTNEKLSKKFRLSKEEFIKKAQKHHKNKYDYSKVNYINAHKLIKIICPKHGQFIQEPNVHMRGAGCQRCAFNGSKAEKKWLNDIEHKNNIIIERNKQIVIENKNFVVDGFYKLTNTIYEYNGSFWHGNPNIYNLNNINPRTQTTFGELYRKTLEKEYIIKSAGYNLITEWGN